MTTFGIVMAIWYFIFAFLIVLLMIDKKSLEKKLSLYEKDNRYLKDALYINNNYVCRKDLDNPLFGYINISQENAILKSEIRQLKRDLSYSKKDDNDYTLMCSFPPQNGKTLYMNEIRQQHFNDIVSKMKSDVEERIMKEDSSKHTESKCGDTQPKKEFDVNAKDSTLVIQLKEREDKILAFKFNGYGLINNPYDPKKYIEALEMLGLELVIMDYAKNELVFKSVIDSSKINTIKNGDYVVSINGEIKIMSEIPLSRKYQPK